ncbi:MAG: SRPBCC family protein [Ferruginibacter sp.]
MIDNTYVAESSVTIDAPVSKVWEALVSPAIIKKYLFGTNVVSDWKEGSAIEYSGEWEGKAYHDKGVIKKLVPEKVFQSTYLSSMSGKEDTPENYNLVTYVLSVEDGKTIVSLTQDNIASSEERTHSTTNWDMVLQKLKEVVEAGNS